MFTRVVLVTMLAVSSEIPMQTQERFSFFAASSQDSVERMLTLARLRDDDVVVDLGSGNGLIPLTAARMNPRLRGRGVEINSKLVEESNQRARTEGVADRVRFEHRNAFDVDLRDATVVTMWVFPELMRLLRPIILERRDSRHASADQHLGSRQLASRRSRRARWGRDRRYICGSCRRASQGHGTGNWRLPSRRFRYSSFVEQHFQKVEGVARSGDRREVLEGMTLRGADITFGLNITLDQLGLTRHEFRGKVEGDEIAGTVKVTPAGQPPLTMPWRARRVERSDYFAPTGTAMFQRP